LWQVPPEVKPGKYEVQVDLKTGPFAADTNQTSEIEIL